jgi:Carboxypeptidase regulatory-like domain/TonB dependent receptor-like, beta-barrel
MVRHIGMPLLAVVIIFGTLLSTPAVRAQTPNGTIVGTVKDASGAVLLGATVTVKNDATGLVRQTVTDERGDYSVPSLPWGRYTVEVKLQGFRTVTVAGTPLAVDQVARVDITMQVGPVTASVTVQGRPELLQTDSSSVGSVIPNALISAIPLNGRNFSSLITLSPASTNEPTAGLGSRVSSGVSIAGGRGSSNDYRLDGGDETNNNVNLPAVNLSLDAIQEFKVQESSFNAEFGHGGAIINIISKSGTNAFHGTMYEYLRNDLFDATDFFTNAAGQKKNPLKQNQFGASAGSFIVKDKLFWFGNYEGLRVRRGATNYMLVPEPQWLGLTANGNADFSDLLPGSGACGGPGQFPCQVINNAVDPGCTINDGFANCHPFPGNIIPANLINSFATTFRQFIPAPNTSMTASQPFNYIAPTTNSNRDDQFTIRVDEYHGSKDRFFARYSFEDFHSVSPGVIPGNGEQLPSRQQSLVLSWNRTQSDKLLNEFRFAFMRLSNSRESDIASSSPQWLSDVFGFVGATYTPGSSPPGVQLGGFIPQGGIGFVSAFGSPLVGSYLTQANNTFEFMDSITFIKHSHTFKAGFDLRHVQFGVGQADFQNGYFGFLNIPAPFTSTFSISDFDLGLPAYVEVGQVDPKYGAASLGISNFWQGYFQDDWKISPKLTLNLGLRYEYNSPPTVARNRQSILDVNDVGEGRFLIADSTSVFLSAPSEFFPCTLGVDCGVVPNVLSKPTGNTLLDPYYKDFAPRIGFAWQLLNKTVLRGGFGIFYDNAMLNDTLFLMQSPPFVDHPFVQLPGNGVNFGFISGSAVPLNPQTLPMPGMGPAAAGRTINPHNRDPYLERYSLSLQREIGSGLLFEVGYLGMQGHRLQRRRYINQDHLGGTNLYPRLSTQLQYADNVANSNYNALTVQLEKRYSSGLNLLASYTWSHAIDDTSFNIGGFEQYTWDLKAERANSDADAPNRLVVGYDYALPFGRGKKFLSSLSPAFNQLLGGWEVAGLTQYQSGFPINITIDSPPVGDPAGTGAGLLRPNCVGPIQLLDIRKNGGAYISPSAFAVPATGTFGNCPRNPVPGPGMATWDISALRNFSVTERYRFQFRAEFFNAFNHAQFQNTGNVDIQQPAFGFITSTLPPREIQFGLRFYF